MTKLVFASDHAGHTLRKHLMACAEAWGHTVLDLGPADGERGDYPLYAARLAQAMKQDDTLRGILICGSGIGACMAANRFSWIRAALCEHETAARLCRQHNDANVLCMGERLIGTAVAEAVLHIFLTTEFEGGRHQQRVEQLRTLGESP